VSVCGSSEQPTSVEACRALPFSTNSHSERSYFCAAFMPSPAVAITFIACSLLFPSHGHFL
jgi:hypothetical protein